jgi:hypothetical protein|tara:strand:+ start:1556 stop:3328 length:1773 start_codon:yes stop_codon:yes gene_type:complete
MGKHIFEEGPRKGHAAGDSSVEQQASQLASDIKYKARQKMKQTAGSDRSPAQVQALYRQLLNASPAPGAVKSIVKKKLFGEQVETGVVPVSETLSNSKSSVFAKVFVEGGGQEEEVIEEDANQKFVVRVTDKATGNTSYRKADRAKIAQLRANPNIASVEITGRKKADDAYEGGDKKAKKDYDGDGKIESGSKEHAGAVHNAIQRKKGGVADGKDTRKEEYVDEGLRSAVKRLLGKKDAPAEKKPESRGEQLRKKYNVGPEKSDTSAKRQILDRTRAKAERDQKEYGGSVYTKKVADKSKAAHDRYLKGGYSKYGADDARGKGNKARRRAEALKKEDFNWLVDTLISEGYNLSSYTVDQFYDFCEEVIYEKEENNKKIDVMKGKNTVKVNPSLGESIRAELDALKFERIQEQEDAMKKEQEERKKEQLAQQQEKKDKMMRMRILRNKMMAARAGTEVNASHQPEGDLISDECDKCGGDHDTKDHGKKEDEDPRSMKTKINLSRNKLRAMGLKMSYDMGDEVVEEETEDSLRDKRMERGGVDGNVRYDKAPKPQFTKGPKKKNDGMSAVERVKADIRAKYGKGSIIDTKKK